MSDKHLSSKFDADLNLLSTRLLEMGGLVESQIAHAMEALNTFDLALVEQVIKGERRDPLEPRLEGDPKFHPRQVRPQAAVNAQAEGGMPVDLAVDDDLARLVELCRVTVGRRERQQDPVVGLHVDAVPVHVLLDQPRHRDRRVGPEELFHRGWQQPGVGD